MRRWVALAALLGGCDYVWHLDHLYDAGQDVVPTDADVPHDTATCKVTHNEDGDLTDDSCDNCPTITGDQTDSDGDGVGDACDPDLGVQVGSRIVDNIQLFAPFTNLDDFATSVGLSPNDTIALANGQFVTTKNELSRPSLAITTVQSYASVTVTSTLKIALDNVSCRVVNTKCTNGLGASCLITQTGVELPLASGIPMLRTLALKRMTATTYECDAELTSGSLMSITDTGSVGLTAKLSLSASGSGTVTLTNAIVYGR